MHESLPFVLALIAIIVLIEMLANKIKVAYPILLVIAGLGISFLPGLPAIRTSRSPTTRNTSKPRHRSMKLSASSTIRW